MTVLAVLLAGCAAGPLADRALRARGGPVTSVVRQVETEVYAGFPGTWRFRMALLSPDRYAWTLYTSGQPDHYLFDGAAARAFVNGQEVAAEEATTAPLRSHARIMALVHLDARLLPGVQVTPLPAVELPAGAAEGLQVVFADDGARYRLGFDGAARLVHASGPLDLPPYGSGEVTLRFDGFRRVSGRVLAHRVHYEFRGAPLADETLLAACVDDPRVTAAAFQRPDLLPECTPP